MKLVALCLLLTGCGAAVKAEGDALDRLDVSVQTQQDEANDAIARKRAEFEAELEWILQQLPELQVKLLVDLKAKYCSDSQFPACGTISNL